jgi:hypothetical protein
VSEEGVQDAGGDGLVWHYTNAAGLLSIVNNHVLWATASGYLNDRAEVNLGYHLLEAELDSRAGSGDAFARRVLDGARASERSQAGPSPSSFFILSAAEEGDLLSMWRCYGGERESYALGLDPTAPLRILCDPKAAALESDGTTHLARQRPWSPVRYDADEQRALAEAVFDGMEGELAALGERVEREGEVTPRAVLETLGETLDDIEQALALIKHPGFRGEQEVRHSTVLLHPSALSGWGGVVRYRPSPYGMAPHLWLTGDDPEATDSPPFTSTAARLPVRAVAISPSPNGVAAEGSLRAMLVAHGYDVDVRRSPIPFRG